MIVFNNLAEFISRDSYQQSRFLNEGALRVSGRNYRIRPDTLLVSRIDPQSSTGAKLLECATTLLRNSSLMPVSSTLTRHLFNSPARRKGCMFSAYFENVAVVVIRDLKNRAAIDAGCNKLLLDAEYRSSTLIWKIETPLPRLTSQERSVLQVLRRQQVGFSDEQSCWMEVGAPGAPQALTDVFIRRRSQIMLSSFLAIPQADGGYAARIRAGDLVSSPVHLLTSIYTQKNKGFPGEIRGFENVYYLVDGYGSPLPNLADRGEVGYLPEAVFRVNAIERDASKKATYVWLEEVTPLKFSTIRDLISGQPYTEL